MERTSVKETFIFLCADLLLQENSRLFIAMPLGPGFVFLLLVTAAICKIFFDENFDDDSWTERWTHSKQRPYDNHGSWSGKFERSAKEYYGDGNNTGLRTMRDNQLYAISARFPEITLINGTFVLQFSLKSEQETTVILKSGVRQKEDTICQVAFFQLHNCPFEPLDLNHTSPFAMQFHFSLCQNFKTVSVNVNYLGEEHRVASEYKLQFDWYTHMYTFIMKPDLSYHVYVDTESVSSGSLVQLDKAEHNDAGFRFGVENLICGIGFLVHLGNSGTVLDNVMLSDEVKLAERKLTEIMPRLIAERKGRAAWLIALDSEDLISILEHKGNLTFTDEQCTESFLVAYKKFLVPFSWSNNKSVVWAAANYNTNAIATNSSLDPIQLWVSFQPQDDISDDIGSVLKSVNEANSIHPGTVTTIVIDYGFLQIDAQSVSFVKHEVRKVSRSLKSSQGEILKLGLQIANSNCGGRPEYFNEGLLDVLLIVPMPMTKEFFLNKVERDRTMDVCLSALDLRTSRTLTIFHAHVSIEINLVESVYKYDRSLFINSSEYEYRKDMMFLMHVEKHGESNELNTDHVSMQANAGSWLYQPSYFSNSLFGTVISWKENELDFGNFSAAIFDTFRHILIDNNKRNSTDGDRLEAIFENISSHVLPIKQQNVQMSNDLRSSNNEPKFQASILITISINDFEVNKRQADTAISAALKGNDIISPGTVNTIFFDWMTCIRSETCSGSMESDCWEMEKYENFSKITDYAKEKLDKMEKNSTVRVGVMIDTQLFHIKENSKCNKGFHKRDFSHKFDAFLCKTVVYHKDVVNYGGLKTFKVVTDGLLLCTSLKRSCVVPFSLFVNVIGCDCGPKSIQVLMEYTRFLEKLNGWATAENISLFTNAGVEAPSKCDENMQCTAEERYCECGWWIRQEPYGPYQDKKTIARQLYENTRENSKVGDGKSVTTIPIETLLWTLVPTVVFAIILTVSTAFFVFRYRSKYILTKQEVAAFINGRQAKRAGTVAEGDNAAESQSYNKEKYELSLSKFTIDITSACLGSGEFGRVYRGSIRRDGNVIETAVKMANSSVMGKSHRYYLAVKSLISEIKILTYVGNHNHIVSLLGAYTKNMRKGEIAVFLELCQLGSMDKYLRSIKPQTRKLENEDELATHTENQDVSSAYVDCDAVYMQYLDQESCDNLYRWAGEIANGMEFLSSKKLIHGDLATRNILLTSEKVAKISDFGLSRRLYDYTEYVKRSQAPLPWRWLAPESLCKLFFDEKTDVWSFGVTLWEMFTLGDEPYPGLSWTPNFPALLEDGMRLHEPRYNVKQIYSTMLQCWNISPEFRPTFAELNSELNSLG